MVAELAHTSALAGIDPGTSGFTTVVRTSGMSGETRRALEQLSAYKPDGNPAMPIFGHRILRVAARPIHIMTLIQPCGADHSGRENRIAWHLALEASEIVNSELLGALDWLVERTQTWDHTPAIAPEPLVMAESNEEHPDLEAWSGWGCDTAWANSLAHLACEGEPTAIVVPQGVDLIRLTREIIKTIEPRSRWNATLSTGTTGLDPNTTLRLVIVHEGTQAAQRLKAGVARHVIELPAAKCPANRDPVAAGLADSPAEYHSQKRPLRETHAYLFDEAPEQIPEEPLPIVEPIEKPNSLDAPSGVSKPLIALIAIGIIALVGLLVLIVT